MTIEKSARRAIREMAQAPDRGYTREEVLVTFLQEQRDDMRRQAAKVADKYDWSSYANQIAKEIGDLK